MRKLILFLLSLIAPKKEEENMPKTIRKGDKGSEVSLCQQDLNIHGYLCTVDGIFGSGTEAQVKLFQTANNLTADGIVGTNTWAALEAPPADEEPTEPGITWSDERPWSDFVPLLGPAMGATYSLTGAQLPKFPPGVTFLSSKFLGESYSNCSMFTAYFLGNGFGGPFTKDQWMEWQVAKGTDQTVYRGYGPSVACEWGVGEMTPANAVPKNGVYLIQSFSTWPKGHSWIVIDYDEDTDKILTLESNGTSSGINGVGFGSLGPIRSTNAHDWKNRVTMTWEGRTRSYSQIYMAKLAIDHQTVLEWIESQ